MSKTAAGLATLLASLLSLTASVSAHAADVAIGGYSPVAYFTEGEALPGSEAHSVTHAGKTYHLRNAEEVALFNENPDQYVPRYEICPYSLAHGDKLPLDPTNFQIVGGYLLLFHKSEEADGLAAFRSSGLSEQELLDRADKQFTLLRF